MGAPRCTPVASESDLATSLQSATTSTGRSLVPDYDTAKAMAKMLKPALDSWQKTGKVAQLAKGVKDKDFSAVPEALGAYMSTAQYVSKLQDWEVASKLAQQSAKTFGFVKVMKLATPTKQAVAVGVLATEKILLQFGLVTDDQRLKCVTALATLGADAVAMAALSTATGGVAAAFFAVSFAWSVADTAMQCAPLLDKKKPAPAKAAPPQQSLKLH